MKLFATHRPHSFVLLLTGLLALAGARAEAQIVPTTWDHYKLYNVNPKPAVNIPVILNDQFGVYPHQVQFLDLYMNPVEKIIPPTGPTYPINEGFLHYAWWRISPQFNEKLVAATNQFGDQTLFVRDAEYLLNPSLKNQTGPLPVRNHYKCYKCEGQPVNRNVVMFDQFGNWSATVTFPRWFCNPVKKTIDCPNPPCQTYDQVDPARHYTCYEFTPTDNNLYSATILDQFIQTTVQLNPSRWICVPTIKQNVTPTKKDTWGSLKQLYR